MTLLQQVAKVEALRASATDGDWLAVRDGSGDYAVHAPDEEWTVAVGVTTCDAAFIAACGSFDFRALHDELTRLREALAEIEDVCLSGDTSNDAVSRTFRGLARTARAALLPNPERSQEG